MRAQIITSALVAFITATQVTASVPGIAALSCQAPKGQTNSSRVIKKHRKHQTPLAGQHQTTGGHKAKNHTSVTAHNATTPTKGLITVVDAACGPTDPTLNSDKNSGPNGARQWINCGISTTNKNSGWTPPNVQMSQIVYKTMDTSSNSVFAPCKPYLSIFDAVSKSTGIPTILIAAIAMTESTCNPNSSGDNGDAYGLMQITSDKCGGAPGGNCADPEFNVKTGMEYFASQIKAFGGNVFEAMGQYNGWNKGMSFDSATAAANSGCCECQNNLDYLHGVFNGYLQNIDAGKLVFYNNLASCGS